MKTNEKSCIHFRTFHSTNNFLSLVNKKKSESKFKILLNELKRA